MKKQHGFTLIELGVVIIILGILAVTAAPKFINLQSDARASTIAGLEAALKGGDSLVYSKSLIAGNEALASTETPAPKVTVAKNKEVNLNFGHPIAEWTGSLEHVLDIDASAESPTDETTEWVYDTDTDIIYFYPQGQNSPKAAAPDTGACYVKYENSVTDTDGTLAITSLTTGC